MQAQKTLYNKYRPQAFAEVIDQNHIKVTLQNEIASGKLTHAYLFTGPRGIGKTTVARILAKTVNCENRKEGESEPCNNCQSCNDINQGKSLDLVEIDAASQTKVDQTRENIIAASRVSASAGRTKIFIIDEVHMLSTASFNALLKTLEEPPAKVLFILATTEVHKVPETIISRCQRFDFHRIGIEDLVKWQAKICQAEGYQVSRDVLMAVAKQSEGGARDTLSLLGQILTLSDKKITFAQASLVLPRSDWTIVTALVDCFVKYQADKAIDLLNKSLDEGVDLNQLVKDLIEYLRQILLLKLSDNREKIKLDLDKDSQKLVADQAEGLTVLRLVEILDILLVKFQQIKFSTIPRLPIELAFIIICRIENKTKNDIDRPDNAGSNPHSLNQDQQTNVDSGLKDVIKQETIPKDPPRTKSKLKLSDIQSKWLDILKDLKQYNHSLSAFLKVARPISVENGVFTIGFQYSFHCEILENISNRKVVGEIVSKHINDKIEVRGILDDQFANRAEWLVSEGPAGDEEKKTSEEPKVDVAAAFG